MSLYSCCPFLISILKIQKIIYCVIYLWGGLYFHLLSNSFKLQLDLSITACACRIVWYACNILYVVTCILLETYAGAFLVLNLYRYPVIAITSNKCMITNSAFSEHQAFAHWNPEHVSMIRFTCFNLPKLEKWNPSIRQTSFLWVPFGLLPAGNEVWLYQE